MEREKDDHHVKTTVLETIPAWRPSKGPLRRSLDPAPGQAFCPPKLNMPPPESCAAADAATPTTAAIATDLRAIPSGDKRSATFKGEEIPGGAGVKASTYKGVRV